MKTCKNCGQTLTDAEFYKTKSMCIYCYKRKTRLKARVAKGKPIGTIADLMKELRTLPPDAKLVLCDNVNVYCPSTVEFVRPLYKGNKEFDTDKYNNTVVIV